MQFPVPQFTDVEDRIIANLTFRQFGIILGTGGLIFMSYSISKDLIVTGFAALFIGVPGLVLAFGQFNGRPLYRSIFLLINFLTSTRVLVFQKQGISNAALELSSVEVKKVEPDKKVIDEDPISRLRKIQYQLEQRAKEEEEALKKV